MSKYGYQEKALAALDELQEALDDVRREVEANHLDDNGAAAYLRLPAIYSIAAHAHVAVLKLLEYKETPW